MHPISSLLMIKQMIINFSKLYFTLFFILIKINFNCDLYIKKSLLPFIYYHFKITDRFASQSEENYQLY